MSAGGLRRFTGSREVLLSRARCTCTDKTNIASREKRVKKAQMAIRRLDKVCTPLTVGYVTAGPPARLLSKSGALAGLSPLHCFGTSPPRIVLNEPDNV